MKRVAIVGCSGAGKSTLARALGPKLDLPVVHFDQLHWMPGWKERSVVETQARINEALSGDRWLSDGNYLGYSKTRLERADCIVWLDYPTRICVQRVLKRIRTTRGMVREDMAAGCPERFDPAFLTWVLCWRRDHRPGLLDRVLDTGKEWVWLRHPRQTRRWLAAVNGSRLR